MSKQTVTLPEIMGNEEYLAIAYSEMQAPRMALKYTPDDLRNASTFFDNFYRKYPDNDNFGIATPEYTNPSQLTENVRGTERLAIQTIENRVRALSAEQGDALATF